MYHFLRFCLIFLFYTKYKHIYEQYTLLLIKILLDLLITHISQLLINIHEDPFKFFKDPFI